MITLLTGENSFELKRALDAIVSAFDGAPEKVDGSELELSNLPDLLTGMSLFAESRLVVIRNLSENKSLWEVLPSWVERIGDDIHVVLVEAKLDKRTKSYKELKKVAETKEFSLWNERDIAAAENWVIAEAKRQEVTMDKKSAQLLVDRVGMDQWQLFHTIEKLAALGETKPEIIIAITEASPQENVFNLFDSALRGDTKKVSSMIATLQINQDPYMTFGLLSGQVFQLAALSVADKTTNEVAGDIGAHPYALGKLAPYTKRLEKSHIKRIVQVFADADTAMKSTVADPWLLIEQALIKTAS